MRPTGTIRMRSNSTFEIGYSVGTDLLTGKRKRVFLTIKGTRQQAEKEYWRGRLGLVPDILK